MHLLIRKRHRRLIPAAALWLAASAAAQEPLAERPSVLHLSMKQALDIALSPEGNNTIQIAGAETDLAAARSREALSALLPSLDGSVNISDYTLSFSAEGFTQVPLPFGLKIPERVGPITTADVRSTVSGNILSLSSIRRYQSSRAGVRAAHLESDNAKEAIATQVARQYITALRAQAEVEAVEANLRLAEALVEQAKRLKEAGTGTGLDVTRGEVQVANEQQRLQAARSDLKQAHLNLLRTMHQNLDLDLDLTDRLRYVPVDPVTLAQAKSLAEKKRPDLNAQKQREEVSRLALSASRMEQWPSIAGFANYGSTGNVEQGTLPTYTFGVAVRVPVYDSGRRRALAAETSAQYREQKLRTQDLSDQIELEIRLALERLESAEQQMKTAQAGLALAESELEQVNRRFREGVATGLEVTDSQTRLARARDNQIQALYVHNLGRIDLSHAMGSVLEMVEK